MSKTRIINAHLTKTHIYAHFEDGRIVGCPIAWFKHLSKGSAEERNIFEIAPDGESIHWPKLDEDLSAEGFFSFTPKRVLAWALIVVCCETKPCIHVVVGAADATFTLIWMVNLGFLLGSSLC